VGKIGLVMLLLGIAAGCSTPRPRDAAVLTVVPTPDRNAALDVDARALVADPAGYIGFNMILQGLALNVAQQKDATWIAFFAGVMERPSETMVVILKPREPKILKGECYRFFAVGAGSSAISTDDATDLSAILTGQVKELPTVHAYYYEDAPRAESGRGCAVRPVRARPITQPSP
jgi:hypothetical protein